MNTKMQKKILVGLLASPLAWAIQPAFSESINDVVTQTLQSNPEVLMAVNGRLASDAIVDQASADYYPKADITLGIGREWTDSNATQKRNVNLKRSEAGLTATQMLYDGYSTKGQVDRSESLVEVAAYQIADTSERIGFDAAQSFLEVLRNQDLVALAEENLLEHKKVNDQIALRASSGVGRGVDINQSTARVALAQSNIFAADGTLTDAHTTYKRVVGQAAENLDKQEDCCDSVPSTLKEALEIAFVRHPSLNGAVASYEASMAETSVAKSAMYPTVNLELETNTDDNVDGSKGSNKDILAMFRLRQNIINGGADKARITQTEYLTAQQKEVVESTKRIIEQDVRLAWNALENAATRLPYLKKYAKSSRATRDAYQQQFSLGQRTLLDLLDVENEKFTAQSDYINGSYDEKIACYRLLASMGVLIDTLNVAPVEDSVVAPN